MGKRVARLLAREYAAAGWDVLIADMDIQQGTSFDWNTRKLEAQLEPDISVQKFSAVDRAARQGEKYDLVIFDGSPHATKQTQQIAEICQMVILPAGSSKDDLTPQIRLAHELSDIISSASILFVLTRVGSDMETEGAKDWIRQAE